MACRVRLSLSAAACCALLAAPASPALAMPPLEGVLQVSGGGDYTCAVLDGGRLVCWGQVPGSAPHATTATPVPVEGVGAVRSVSAGAEYACVVTMDGAAMCWGLNFDGQIGNGVGGFGLRQPTPVTVQGLGSGVAAISAGVEHTCALTTDRAVKCWGRNNAGQLGDGSTTDRYLPVDVVGLGAGVAAVAAGGSETLGYTCALKVAGALRCWGRNERGQLGDGSTTDRHVPTPVAGHGSGIVGMGVGASRTCARDSMGRVTCWGSNGWNGLGAWGFTEQYSPLPLEVTSLASGASLLDVKVDLACAAVSGQARCWGVFHFPVGGVFPVFEMMPVNRGPAGITAIGVGGAGWSLESHVCAITADRRLHCWGGNRDGQLGNGTAAGYSDTPTLVLAGVSIFRAGFER